MAERRNVHSGILKNPINLQYYRDFFKGFLSSIYDMKDNKWIKKFYTMQE